ncbi:hypothetical protein [Streptomyces sp. ICN441]|uniref:hypothetical protein n=1 Tax=Streptomyces sp. ICN441 TaxID=2558286 RepID=UPI001F113D0A|nr:hypothetical protein [Streptomyces sp. ICN441]
MPGAAHSASMKVGALSDTELALTGATANDAPCKGDTLAAHTDGNLYLYPGNGNGNGNGNRGFGTPIVTPTPAV